MHAEYEKAVENLHSAIARISDNIDERTDERNRINGPDDPDVLDDLLWQAVIACQGDTFCTASGLPFSYTVKRKKDGEYSGELLVSRKEGSKTLTRSSVLLAFHKVLKEIEVADRADREGDDGDDGDDTAVLVLPEYKGPKSIGQIFGISYVYSLFWKLGLIKVPAKVEEKLNNHGSSGKCRN
ncbi:MAG: hypothetical protein ACI4D3_09260 [Lachnospiraceae bacterium]